MLLYECGDRYYEFWNIDERANKCFHESIGAWLVLEIVSKGLIQNSTVDHVHDSVLSERKKGIVDALSGSLVFGGADYTISLLN